MRSLVFVLALAGLGLSSCSSMPPPVPVSGSPAQIQALAGSWAGSYSSAATGRYGTVRFTLAAGSDTAHGDVFMVPRKPIRPTQQQSGAVVSSPATPSTLHIAFVHAAGDSVRGTLDPYQDPDCACTLVTWFEGRMSGNRIQGRYTSRNTETGERTFGEWSVKRQKEDATR
jgi:hypothetical protein